jgi:S-adenosylmethionine-diacylgycerolhomoserine-N-methlytransferase
VSDAAALMDGIYARQRFIYDATRKFYLLGRDETIAALAAPPQATILEIGCGTGRNLIAIARRYPAARCYGIDVSEAMLKTARASIAKAGLARRIELAQADATVFGEQETFGIRAFDRIMISYALSMIPPWRAVLEQAAATLAPNGALHIVDFGDQARLPGSFKSVLDAWLRRFHVTPRTALPAEVQRIGRDRGLIATSRPLYRGYAIAACLERPALN